MNYRIEASVTIDAPQEYVWDMLQNLERRLEWDARVVSARKLTDGPIDKGSRIEVITRLYGIDYPAVLEYLTWNPPKRSSVKTVELKRGASEVIGSWALEEQENGSTIWTTTIVMRDAAGPFGRMINRILARTFERLTHQSQAKLKALIEEEYPSRSTQTAPMEPERAVAEW